MGWDGMRWVGPDLFSVVLPPHLAEKVQQTPNPPAHIPVEIPARQAQVSVSAARDKQQTVNQSELDIHLQYTPAVSQARSGISHTQTPCTAILCQVTGGHSAATAVFLLLLA